MRSKLLKNFKNFIFQESIFVGGEKLVVGISGGGDSVALVELLLAVQEKFNLGIQLIHINYHLRGAESDEDEEFVKNYAKDHKLKLEVVDYNSVKLKNKCQKTNIIYSKNTEEALRNFRYKIFEQTRQERKFDWIVVGHHRDDQAETFLMNLFRGSGVRGLSAMQVQDEKRHILRPLLNFSKQEIIKFLQSMNQYWREDGSNQDNSFLRNRIRNKLIPEIEKNYSLKFKKRISGVTKKLQAYLGIVEGDVLKSVELVTDEIKNNKIEIDVIKYGKLDKNIKPLVFRRAIAMIRNGNLKNISENNYIEFEKIMKSAKGKRHIMKFGGLIFNRTGNKMIIKGRI